MMDQQLRDALAPFAAAYKRLRSYGEAPGDDAPLMAADRQDDFTLYELLNGEEGPQVTVADLRRAAELLDA